MLYPLSYEGMGAILARAARGRATPRRYFLPLRASFAAFSAI